MSDAARWLVDALGAATWTDALDIALLSVVIYSVLAVMRGTRALQSLLGLVLVGLEQ